MLSNEKNIQNKMFNNYSKVSTSNPPYHTLGWSYRYVNEYVNEIVPNICENSLNFRPKLIPKFIENPSNIG